MTDTERLPPFVNATERQLRKERAEELAEAFERHLMTAEMLGDVGEKEP